MDLKTEIYGDVAVIRLESELTSDNVGRFEAQLEPPLEETVRRFVVDMEKTEYVDNAGLEAFEDLMEQLREKAGDVRFSGLGNNCRKIFEITRLDKRAELFESVVDAVRSFH